MLSSPYDADVLARLALGKQLSEPLAGALGAVFILDPLPGGPESSRFPSSAALGFCPQIVVRVLVRVIGIANRLRAGNRTLANSTTYEHDNEIRLRARARARARKRICGQSP